MYMCSNFSSARPQKKKELDKNVSTQACQTRKYVSTPITSGTQGRKHANTSNMQAREHTKKAST